MFQKTNLIIIGMGLLLLVAVFTNIQTIRAQKSAEQLLDEAKKNNLALTEKITQKDKDVKILKVDLDAKKKEYEKISSDKIFLQTRVEAVTKERDDLIEKIKNQPAPEENTEQQEQKKIPKGSSAAEEAYWGGVVKAKADLELQLNSARSELKTAKIDNEEIQRQKASMDLDIKTLNRDNQELKQQVDYNQKMLDGISQELVREKNKKMEIEDGFKLLKNENTVVRRQLKSLNDRKIELEREISDLQIKSKDLEGNLNKMQSLLREKLLQVEDMKREVGMGPKDIPVMESSREARGSAVDLPPIVVRPQQQENFITETHVSKTEVLLVNRENNFVIVNLGEDSGIKVGDTLQVNRDNRVIGVVEAIQIRKSFSACDIKKEESPIKVGDKIVR